MVVCSAASHAESEAGWCGSALRSRRCAGELELMSPRAECSSFTRRSACAGGFFRDAGGGLRACAAADAAPALPVVLR
jgi:hypothetical protein